MNELNSMAKEYPEALQTMGNFRKKHTAFLPPLSLDAEPDSSRRYIFAYTLYLSSIVRTILNTAGGPEITRLQLRGNVGKMLLRVSLGAILRGARCKFHGRKHAATPTGKSFLNFRGRFWIPRDTR